eukprot:scaffold310684_cov28-Tisochrysis_lutea.AAC.1
MEVMIAPSRQLSRATRRCGHHRAISRAPTKSTTSLRSSTEQAKGGRRPQRCNVAANTHPNPS